MGDLEVSEMGYNNLRWVTKLLNYREETLQWVDSSQSPASVWVLELGTFLHAVTKDQTNVA